MKRRRAVPPKRFGQVMAFSYRYNASELLPGIGVKVDDVEPEDEFDTQWMRLPEAKQLVADLKRAIAYAEAAWNRRQPVADSRRKADGERGR